jgi:hypothetical protein
MIREILYYLVVFCRKMYTRPAKPRSKLHDAAETVVFGIVIFSLIDFILVLEYMFDIRGFGFFLHNHNVIGYSLGATLFLAFYVLKLLFTRPISIVEKRRRLRKICQKLSLVQPWHSRAICISGITLFFIAFLLIAYQLILKYIGPG